MKLKERDYRKSKPLALKLLREKGFKNLSEIAIGAEVAVAILCLWYIEEIEDTPEAQKKLKNTMTFYGYTDIIRDSVLK